MRKFQNATESEDLLDELLDGIELNAQSEEQTEEVKEEKSVKKEKKVIRYDMENLPIVLERVDAGLIGSLRIEGDKSNKPIIKKGDVVQLRKPNRLLPKDFVFYKIEDEYFLRRIIKFKQDDIYVAGDNEREYHVIHKGNVVAKAVGRERGKHFQSFGITSRKGIYTFRKVNMAFFRLGNRVRSFEQEQNQESLEAAMKLQQQVALEAQKKEEKPTVISADIDLDTDLAAFIDPDDLVRELREEARLQAKEEKEEIVYVDEYGNEIKDYKPEEESNDKGKFMQSNDDDDEDLEEIDEEELSTEDESFDDEDTEEVEDKEE